MKELIYKTVGLANLIYALYIFVSTGGNNEACAFYVAFTALFYALGVNERIK